MLWMFLRGSVCAGGVFAFSASMIAVVAIVVLEILPLV